MSSTQCFEEASITMDGLAGAPEYKKTFKSDFGLFIIVTIASIVDVVAEAVVTGEEESLEHKSLITQTLIQTIPEFYQRRNELKNKYVEAWTVRKTPLSESTKFKFVFHAIYKLDCKNWVNSMIKLYEKVLKKAEKRRIKVLALPLLGSGRGGMKVEDCVQALVTALTAYKPSSLDKVILVSKEWEKADKMSTQCAYAINSLTKQASRSFFGIFSRQSSRARQSTKTKAADHTGASSQTLSAADTGVQRRQNKAVDKRPASALPTCGTVHFRDAQSQNRNTIVGISASDTPTTKLTEESDEYRNVAGSFLCRYEENIPTIKLIERIENSYLRTQYDFKRTQIVSSENHASSAKKECSLWHHTSEDSSKFICTNGFNRSQCGKDGTAGDGVYFTVSPSSDLEDTYMYSQPASDLKYVFRARVLTGTFTTGTPGQRVPPERQAGVLYDSTVDNLDNPHLYVIYSDTQTYPDYLITYTDK